jgi:hypothetical protein
MPTLAPRWSPLAVLLALSIPTGCDEGNDAGTADNPKAGDAKAGDAKAGDAKAGDAKAGNAKAGAGGDDKPAEPEAAPEPAAPKLVMPSTIDANTAIDASELKAAYFAFDKKEVTVVAYCDAFGSGGPLNRCTKWRGVTTDEKATIRCDLKESGNEDPVTKDDAVTIKGTVKYSTWAEVELKDCSFVAMGGEGGDASDLSKPIAGAALVEAVKGWEGKAVKVKGAYQSSTKSTTKVGVSVRVDLNGADGKKGVGCYTKDGVDAPASFADNREGIVATGVIDKPAFGAVGMKDCEFAAR